MPTVGYVFIIGGALLIRAIFVGRAANLGEDLGDFFTAIVTFDVEGLMEVANRKGDDTPAVTGATDSTGAAIPSTNSNNVKSKYKNGEIPNSAMQSLKHGNGKLMPDAAQAFDLMSEAYKKKFGTYIVVTDSYRSYSEQVATKKRKGALAATPGTSNHGWGLAVDLGGGINNFGTRQHTWMRENSETYGWIHPTWAHDGKGIEEPWHWEYVGNASTTPLGRDASTGSNVPKGS